MAAFKDVYSKKSLLILADAVFAEYPEFPREAYLAEIAKTLSKLELKDRVDLIARTLKKFLPSDYKRSLQILLRAVKSDNQLEGFQLWPITHWVMLYGLDHFDASMAALKFLTTRFTAEFAIRPFLIRHREKTLKLLAIWAKDPNVHVRRLVSEGSRPLLPWGERLHEFGAHPEWGTTLLSVLRHDDEVYVRKSVANHLNDFSKQHPEHVVETMLLWRKSAPADRVKEIDWIIRHGSRTLLKKGHPGAMALQGLKPVLLKITPLKLSAKKVRMGEKLEVQFGLTAGAKARLMVDYVIHHQKANGTVQPKVFKHVTRSVEKGEHLEFLIRHAFRKITTRKYYSGAHFVEIVVNGRSLAKTPFQLVIDAD